MKKIINNIEYLVYETGMTLNNENESYYFENDLDYTGDVKCLNFYALKDVVVRGCQNVRGNQNVRGYQIIGGYQIIRGCQNVRGNQDVRGYQIIGGYQIIRGYQNVRCYQIIGGYQNVRCYQDVRGYQIIRGYQDVRSYQIIGGYQIIRGYQSIGGYQNVRGYQDVRFIRVYLYAKWGVLIDRDSDDIKIGCEQKTKTEWIEFFDKKMVITTPNNDRNYAKLESAFKIACQMKEHLILMNDKK